MAKTLRVCKCSLPGSKWWLDTSAPTLSKEISRGHEKGWLLVLCPWGLLGYYCILTEKQLAQIKLYPLVYLRNDQTGWKHVLCHPFGKLKDGNSQLKRSWISFEMILLVLFVYQRVLFPVFVVLVLQCMLFFSWSARTANSFQIVCFSGDFVSSFTN